MKTKNLIALVFFIGMIMAQNNTYRSLFSDFKAARLGDAITIIIAESSQASNDAETTTGKSSNLGLDASGSMDGEPMLPSLDFDIGSRNDFEGGGTTKSKGLVKARISALIDSTYANGNLRVRGSKKIIINGEIQTIEISGIVRPVDISSNNTVYSYNISNAEIAFEGTGKIDDSQDPGLLTKVFHWIF